MPEKWVKVGKVAVDSGSLWLGDPCYVIHRDNEHPLPADLGNSWREYAKRQCDREETSPSGQVAQFTRSAEECPEVLWRAALGVTVRTGYGDGIYDVEARFEDGRVAEVRVVFINKGRSESEWKPDALKALDPRA